MASLTITLATNSLTVADGANEIEVVPYSSISHVSYTSRTVYENTPVVNLTPAQLAAPNTTTNSPGGYVEGDPTFKIVIFMNNEQQLEIPLADVVSPAGWVDTLAGAQVAINAIAAAIG